MREATTFSRILEMKMRFEIGRKLLRSSVDRDGFLRRGWTRACLNDDGKIPSERERLTRFVMIGPSSLKQSFKRKVGMDWRCSNSIGNSHIPCQTVHVRDHGIRETPSGFFPSLRNRPGGSLVDGICALVIARQIMSLIKL